MSSAKTYPILRVQNMDVPNILIQDTSKLNELIYSSVQTSRVLITDILRCENDFIS